MGEFTNNFQKLNLLSLTVVGEFRLILCPIDDLIGKSIAIYPTSSNYVWRGLKPYTVYVVPKDIFLLISIELYSGIILYTLVI
jgi:hypothetical protein